MKRHGTERPWRFVRAAMAALLVAGGLSFPAGSHAADPVRTVRVGFFALDGYHEIDASGRKSGYGYDFLTLLKRYANVRFEYVGYDRSWEDMQRMLADGEIDMVTSAHRTGASQERFAFSSPIGRSTVRLTVRADDDRYPVGRFDAWPGMVIGLLEGGGVNDAVREYAERNGFSCGIVLFPDADALHRALLSGRVDAAATSSLRRCEGERVLSEFHADPFYALVRKGDAALLKTVNDAIAQMDLAEGDWKH